MAYYTSDSIPRGFIAKITEKQAAFELVSNDLQAIAYEIFDLELEIQAKNQEIVDLIESRPVPRWSGIDNVLCAIEKNKPEEIGKPGRLPYYMIHSYKMRPEQHINLLRIMYPHMIVKQPQ